MMICSSLMVFPCRAMRLESGDAVMDFDFSRIQNVLSLTAIALLTAFTASKKMTLY